MVASMIKFGLAAVMAGLASVVTAAPVAAHEAVVVPQVSYFHGINVGTQDPWGNCKNTATWRNDFAKIKELSGGKFTHIKLFTTSDCDALMQAVPAAIAENVKIWAGVWAVDDAKFTREKAALEFAIRTYGSAWLAGINVGSESLYRNEIDPNNLAIKIYDVKGMVQIALGAPQVPVGCADTWTAWERGSSKPVVDAVDVVIMNGFPYWQGSKIENALQTLQTAIDVTRRQTGNKQLVIGETGWPTDGKNFGDAWPTTANLQAYWRSAGCWLQSAQIPHFWFSAYDEPFKAEGVERNFGIATFDKRLKIDLAC